MSSAIAWFRRDLRLCDNPALRAALDSAEMVIPFFCLDDRLLHGRHASGTRTQFMLECLSDLDGALRERGSGLVVRHGRPEEELARLAGETGAGQVHFAGDVTPFARARGRALEGLGLELRPHPGLAVVDRPGEIRTRNDEPQTVFTHYFNRWLEEPRREVLPSPRTMPALPARLALGRIPALASLGLAREAEEPATGGEARGRERMSAWLRDGVSGYSEGHDALGGDRTSRLSPYLRFGCVSPRELEERLPGGGGPGAFRRQLCWRDFYQQVLLHHPRNARSEFQERYRGAIRWSYAERKFERWSQGRTGFPLVDAGMRQLRREGWMHNRARLVVGSFLTKDLGIDWRWGERHFMRYLLDGDEASNNGNWQWIASVGTDPQPVFRRIYNPALHMKRFDPDGKYVRRHVPELAGVPSRYLAEPWEMPAEVQREAGCVIGQHYPAPMVDRREAREHALERYRV